MQLHLPLILLYELAVDLGFRGQDVETIALCQSGVDLTHNSPFVTTFTALETGGIVLILLEAGYMERDTVRECVDDVAAGLRNNLLFAT